MNQMNCDEILTQAEKTTNQSKARHRKTEAEAEAEAEARMLQMLQCFLMRSKTCLLYAYFFQRRKQPPPPPFVSLPVDSLHVIPPSLYECLLCQQNTSCLTRQPFDPS